MRYVRASCYVGVVRKHVNEIRGHVNVETWGSLLKETALYFYPVKGVKTFFLDFQCDIINGNLEFGQHGVLWTLGSNVALGLRPRGDIAPSGPQNAMSPSSQVTIITLSTY